MVSRWQMAGHLLAGTIVGSGLGAVLLTSEVLFASAWAAHPAPGQFALGVLLVPAGIAAAGSAITGFILSEIAAS